MSGFWSYRGTGTSSAHSHDLLVHSVLPFGLESHGIHEQHTVASTEVKEVSGLEETLFLSPDGSEGSSLEVTVEVGDPVGVTLKAPSFDGGATCGSPLTFRDRLDEEVQLSQKSWWKQRLGIDLDETHPHDAWVGQGARLGTDDGQLDETEQHMVQEVLCRVAQCKPRVPGTVDARQLVPAKDSSGISPHMRPAPWSPTIAVAPRLRTSSRASRECIKLAVEQQGHTSDVKAKILRGSVRHPRPTPSVPPSPAFLRRMEARATCRKESRDKLLARSSVVMTSNMSSLSSSPSPYTASASSSRGSIPFREIASAVQSQMRDFCTPELTAELLHLAEHFRACEVARQVLFAWRKKRLQILARRMSRTADEMAIEHNNICTKMFQSVTETHWRLQYAHLTQDEEVGRLTVLSGEMSERTAIVRYHRKTAAVVLLSERTQRRLRTLLRWYFVLWVASTEERRLQQAAATYRNFLTECAERSVALMMHEHV